MRTIVIALMLLLASTSDVYYTTPEEIDEEVDKKTIFYGSTVRIESFSSQYFLHSHQVSYGTGSQQQSVTGMQTDNDYNSLWTFKECHGERMRLYDEEVKCGDCIRLEHMLTQKNLHSHPHNSPVSGNQEVSAYGDGGNGDTSDNWILQCENKPDGTPFKAAYWFYLRHKVTQRYLRTSKRDNFNQRNCGYRCPIEGQLEISATLSKGDDNKWKVYAGLFYTPKKDQDVDEEGRHCNSYGSCDDIEDSDEFETVDYKKISDL